MRHQLVLTLLGILVALARWTPVWDQLKLSPKDARSMNPAFTNVFEEFVLQEPLRFAHRTIVPTPAFYQRSALRLPYTGPASKGYIIGPAVTQDELSRLLFEIDEAGMDFLASYSNLAELIQTTNQSLVDRIGEIEILLHSYGASKYEISTVHNILKHPGKHFKLFLSIVRGTEWYLLGSKEALAADLMIWLWKAEQEGSEKDLLAEYVLHEILENTSLSHRQIIRFTNLFFKRSEFKKPKDTPLGKVLRRFINSRAIVFWNGEMFYNAVHERKLFPTLYPNGSEALSYSFHVTDEGKIAKTGPLIVTVRWKDNGQIEIIRVESIQVESNVERHYDFDGPLPNLLLQAIKQYNDGIQLAKNKTSQTTSESTELAAILMAGQQTNQGNLKERERVWIRMLRENPFILPEIIHDPDNSRTTEVCRIVKGLIDAYDGWKRNEIDLILDYLAKIESKCIPALLNSIQLSVHNLYAQKQVPPLSGRFYENALALETRLANFMESTRPAQLLLGSA